MAEIRPNYYRVKVRVRLLDINGCPSPESRASTLVELECQDLIEVLGNHYAIGNALKYLFRAGQKAISKLDDLRKAGTYIYFAITEEEEKQVNRDC